MVGKPKPKGVRGNGTRKLYPGRRAGVGGTASKKTDLRLRLSQNEPGRQVIASSESDLSETTAHVVDNRLSQKQTKHTDLSEIKVKTLDEIKREKQQRLQAEEAAKGNQPNGEESSAQNDCFKPVASHGEATPSCSVTTHTTGKTLSLRIPLINFPQKFSGVTGAEATSTKLSSPQELHLSQSSSDMDNLHNEELESYDDGSEEEFINEDDILRENSSIPLLGLSQADEDEDLPTTSTPFNKNHPVEHMNSAEYQQIDEDGEDSTSSSVVFSDVPLGSSYNEDDLDEIISLHPMSTEFDEEEEKMWHSKGSSHLPSSEKRQSIIEHGKKQHNVPWNDGKNTISTESPGKAVTMHSFSHHGITDDSLDDSRKERSWQEDKNAKAKTNVSSTVSDKRIVNDSHQRRNPRWKKKPRFSQKKDLKSSRQHGQEHMTGSNAPGLLPLPFTNPFSSSGSSSLSQAMQQLEEIKRCQDALVKQNPLLPLAVQIMSNQGAFGPNPIQNLQNSERFEFARPAPPGEQRRADLAGCERTRPNERRGIKGKMLGPFKAPGMVRPPIPQLMTQRPLEGPRFDPQFAMENQINNPRMQGNMIGSRMRPPPMDGRRMGPRLMNGPRMEQAPMEDSQMGLEPRIRQKGGPALRERMHGNDLWNRPKDDVPFAGNDLWNRPKDDVPFAGNNVRPGDRTEQGGQKRRTEMQDYMDTKRKVCSETNKETTTNSSGSDAVEFSSDICTSNETDIRQLETNLEDSKRPKWKDSGTINIKQTADFEGGISRGAAFEVNVNLSTDETNKNIYSAKTQEMGQHPELKHGDNVDMSHTDGNHQETETHKVVGNQKDRPVATNPVKTLTDIFWESDTLPKGFCYAQLERGSCLRRLCRFTHISGKDVEEYQRIKKLKLANIPRERSENVEQSKDVASVPARKEAPYSHVNTTKTSFQNKCETILSLLSNGNVAGAMQLMGRMDRMQETPGLALIERCLVTCSQNTSDCDTSAQVAMKAFNMIGKVREKHNRHDFTTLIQCLCNAGQYVMAYQKLSTMKQIGHMPTLDVFINLIKSSKTDPKWAFQLLNEIRQLDLFKPRICSELILLGSTSNPPLVSEVLDLYQLMLQSTINPSQEDYNCIIKMLCNNGLWDNLCKVLCSYNKDLSQIPVQALEGVITSAVKNVEWTGGIINLLASLLQQGPIVITPEAWHNLLASVSSEQYQRVEHSLWVLEWIEKCNIPFNPQSYLTVIAALARHNMTDQAMAVFEKLAGNTNGLQDPGVYEPSLQAFCKALHHGGDFSRLFIVLHFMMDHGIKPQEEILKIGVDILAEEKNFLGVYQLFKQCQNINLVPPVAIYRKILSALEKFKEKPEAATEVYFSFRKAYPVISDECERPKPDVNSATVRSLRVKKVLCKYLNTPRGCVRGDKCTFLHPGEKQAPYQVCKFINTPSGCANGSECRFLHPNGFAPEVSTNQNQSAMQGEAAGTMATNPFVLKDLQGEFGQLNSPFAPAAQCVSTDQQFGQSARRTRSADWPYTSHEDTVGQPHQGFIPQNWNLPNSAPVSHSETVTESGFQFPNKNNPHFYIPRIQFAGAQRQWGDIAMIYTEMKSAGVTMEQDVITNICAAFTSNGVDNVSDIFVIFLSKLQGCLQQIQPQTSAASPGAPFDEQDKFLVGEIGICLMHLCHSHQAFREAYTVLHKLHEHQILYSHPSKGFGSVAQLSAASVTILAADTCLKALPPQYEGALVVLENANYLNSEESCLTKEELGQRTHIFQSLTSYLLRQKNYPRALELLQKLGDRDAFGIDQRATLYNNLLKCLVSDGLLDLAKDVFEDMKGNFISRNTEVVRALVNGFAETGRLSQAKMLFESDSNAYPNNGFDPWTLIIPSSLTAIETQFSIERHLNELHEKVIMGPDCSWYTDDVCNPLKIILRFKASTDSFAGNLEERRMADQMRNIIEKILVRFNPPIICEPKGERFEEIVLPRDGLRRWFMANPITGRHRHLSYGRNNRDSSDDNDLRNLLSHPYLQPGMVNPFTEARTIYEIENEGDEGRVVRVVNEGSSSSSSNPRQQTTGSFAIDANQERIKNEKKDFRSRVAHTMCGRLTRYLKTGIIQKDDFKKHARSLTQQFIDTQHVQDIPRLLSVYESDTRLRVVQFVDDFFLQHH